MTTEFARHDLAKNPSNGSEPDRVRVIREGVASYLPDIDPEETSEWLESFDELLERSGPSRARYLMLRLLERAGEQRDQVVQEWGWDEDVDDNIRAAVEDACGSELLDEDTDEVVDVALLWWRDGDGDLVDTLMDAISPLAEDGVIWVLTPKTGKPGHVLPAEIAEAAPTAGLMPTSSVNLGDWAASRLVQPKSRGAGKR